MEIDQSTQPGPGGLPRSGGLPKYAPFEIDHVNQSSTFFSVWGAPRWYFSDYFALSENMGDVVLLTGGVYWLEVGLNQDSSGLQHHNVWGKGLLTAASTYPNHTGAGAWPLDEEREPCGATRLRGSTSASGAKTDPGKRHSSRNMVFQSMT